MEEVLIDPIYSNTIDHARYVYKMPDGTWSVVAYRIGGDDGEYSVTAMKVVDAGSGNVKVADYDHFIPEAESILEQLPPQIIAIGDEVGGGGVLQSVTVVAMARSQTGEAFDAGYQSAALVLHGHHGMFGNEPYLQFKIDSTSSRDPMTDILDDIAAKPRKSN